MFASFGSPTPPDEVVNEYWGLFQNGDTKGALELVIDGRENEVGDTVTTEAGDMTLIKMMILIQ